MIGFIAGAFYFGYKAFVLHEKWVIYALAGGLATGVMSSLLGRLIGYGLLGIGIRGVVAAIILTVLVTAASIYMIDRWSGLYWDKTEHAEAKNKEEKN